MSEYVIDLFSYPVFDIEAREKFLENEEYQRALTFFRQCVQDIHKKWQYSAIDKSEYSLPSNMNGYTFSNNTLIKVFKNEMNKINVRFVMSIEDNHFIALTINPSLEKCKLNNGGCEVEL